MLPVWGAYFRNFTVIGARFKKGPQMLSRICVASPQTSFGVRLSRIHFSPTDKRLRDKRTPKDVCGEARICTDCNNKSQL